MTNSAIPKVFLRSVLHNGVGRYVCQLQRITLYFSKKSGASRGMRDFIEGGLIDFARRNPGTVVYVEPELLGKCRITAEYLNGYKQTMVMTRRSAEDITRWIELMRTQSGVPTNRLVKMWSTQQPSTQGSWTPFTNCPTNRNIVSYPNGELSRFRSKELSPSEKILKIAQELRAQSLEKTLTNEL